MQLINISWIIRCPLLLLIAIIIPENNCCAFSLQQKNHHHPSSSFSSEVKDFLSRENVRWHQVELPDGFQQQQQQQQEEEDRNPSNAVLEILRPNQPSLLLHILPTPQKQEHSYPPQLNRRLTDYFAACATATATNNNRNQSLNLPFSKIVHLHQDVWQAKPDIVRCRLLAQLGRSKRRIFARKTTSERINATAAIEFLNNHHQWGATRAKYYYGLFQGNELVAVATFSSRRKIQRNGKTHNSHELLRFCARRDATVVGGVSKLIQLFINEQKPDDIVTVVDRDWGTGQGWHSVGFETVATMNPLAMVVSPKEPGLRRHLVGAGIVVGRSDATAQPKKAAHQGGGNDRVGLDPDILEELDHVHSAEDALQVLARHSYFPVYDSGVERLMKIVSGTSSSSKSKDQLSGKELWRKSNPTYATSYYSNVTGIAALLQNIESSYYSLPLDSEQHLSLIASWRATSGTARAARLVFAAPSSLDVDATVEVRERANGWRTVGIVGGATKSIYHAVYKVDPKSHSVDPSAVVSETYKTMSALALAVLSNKPEQQQQILRFLHYGFGAGTLARLLAHHVVDSQHVAVELDSGVVAASTQCGQLVPNNIRLEIGDALKHCQTKAENPYDCVLIDIFDGNFFLPKDFYEVEFLTNLRDNVMGPFGIIVHNFHSGGKKRARQIEEATAMYSSVFPYCFWVDSLDSKPNAGNAILLASKFTMEQQDLLSNSALLAQKRWALPFDCIARARTIPW